MTSSAEQAFIIACSIIGVLLFLVITGYMYRSYRTNQISHVFTKAGHTRHSFKKKTKENKKTR